MRIDARDVERIATRVVELLRAEQDQGIRGHARMVDAAELAAILGVSRDWVYLHARDLGAVRLGGPSGRRRYDVRAVQERFAAIQAGELEPPRRSGKRAYGRDAVPPKIGGTAKSGRGRGERPRPNTGRSSPDA